MASSSIASSATARMPLPPPPADALTRTGRPTASAAARTPASVWSAGVSPGTTGTPARTISARAPSFEPMLAMASGGGPTNVSPASRHAAANAAFSDRKP